MVLDQNRFTPPTCLTGWENFRALAQMDFRRKKGMTATETAFWEIQMETACAIAMDFLQMKGMIALDASWIQTATGFAMNSKSKDV